MNHQPTHTNVSDLMTHIMTLGVCVEMFAVELLSLKDVVRIQTTVSTDSTVKLNANTALRRERAVFIAS